jgi:hypothetical protein
MSFDVKKLRKAFREVNPEKAAAALKALPKWKPPRPGVSTALFVPKRRKAGGDAPAKETETEAG